MKTRSLKIRIITGFCLGMCLSALYGQTKFVAVNAPTNSSGNATPVDYGIGNDFYVNSPVTVSQLGVFDDQSDGVQGPTVLTVQLYARSGSAGTLLETLTFDAANPGKLVNGN